MDKNEHKSIAKDIEIRKKEKQHNDVNKILMEDFNAVLNAMKE